MLNPTTIEIVKSTAPLIAQTGPKLTAHFYERVFSRHPELKDIFNMSNQFSGAQREALFNAVYGYAANIDNLPALLPVVEKIAQKHASFNITPEMYAIVGENLLATIDELFSPGQEVLDAWAEAYGVLADVFITREEEIYQQSETAQGGWRGTRTFKLVSKTPESSVITSFVFEPVDGKPVATFQPGQYIGLYLQPDTFANREIRQYSLSAAPNGKNYRISVKRDAQGTVSNYLHDHLNVGDSVELAPPSGDFFFQSASDTPVTLISGGVGLTPMLAMLESLSGQHSADIHWLHAAENAAQQAFAGHVAQLVSKHANATQTVWLREMSDGDSADYQGLMDIRQVAGLTDDSRREFYLCGPIAFMQSIAKQLLEAGVDKDRIKYECFGPHKVI